MRFSRLSFLLLLITVPVYAQKTLTDGIKDLASQISASVTKEQKKRIAVMPFQELDGGSTVLGTYLAEELLSHLVNSGLKIVERGMLDKLLAEQKLQSTGAIDPATAMRVGKVAGVDAIVTGSVTDLQSNVGVNCRIIDTTTGEVFAAAQAKITKDDDVKKIMAVVIRPPSASPQKQPGPNAPPKATTYSWESGQFYVSMDGLQASGNSLSTTVTLENRGSDGGEVHITGFWLIDENGDRWRSKFQDGSDSKWVAIAPGTKRRFRFTFQPETSSSGTVFTLTDSGNQRSLVQNLVRPSSAR